VVRKPTHILWEIPFKKKKKIRARDRCAAVCLPFLRHNSKSFKTPLLKYREKLQYHNSHQSVSFVTSHVSNYLKLVPWCDIQIGLVVVVSEALWGYCIESIACSFLLKRCECHVCVLWFPIGCKAMTWSLFNNTV